MQLTDDWQPSATVDVLRRRAELIRQIRLWFYIENILEVETPQLSLGATTDPNIESFSVGKRHLRTSVEFHHKRLLAAGSQDIYELGKVFRVDETGRNHNPEFTMLEWYRCGLDHMQLISDVESLIRFLSKDETLSLRRISYREFWLQHSRIDLVNVKPSEIVAYLESSEVSVPKSVSDNMDALQDLAMATVLADAMSPGQYLCIYDYPASQASLARINRQDADWHVASRFEIYFGAVELANGFHELTDAEEQHQRFKLENQARTAKNQVSRPIDERFIAALESGLPDCAGVAIGVDRLMMCLLDDVSSVQSAISFNWCRA